MGRMWKNVKSAMQEFRVSRFHRKSSSRFREIERRKCSQRLTGCRPRLLRRYRHIRTGSGAKNTKSRKDVPVNFKLDWSNWKEIKVEKSPALGTGEFAELANSFRASTRSISFHWDGGELADALSSSNHWEDRDWGLSSQTPQLRGKITALSSLMKTFSDRYARRTGKLTPMHVMKQPLLRTPISASPMMASRASGVDFELKRFENPYQDFLRRSFEQRKFSVDHCQVTGEFWSMT